MAAMNIAGLTAVDDPSYRYKMPRIVVKNEGRGNGVKTVLMNVEDIGLSLNRDPNEITKFLGIAKTTQTTLGERSIINGTFQAADLQTHLARYIENFVLCKQCHLPETHYKFKGDTIWQKCAACGSKDQVDATHKLCAFIIAQHKKAKDSAPKGDKSSKKKDKEKKQKDGGGEDSPPPVGGGESGPVGEDGVAPPVPPKEKKLKKKRDAGGADDATNGDAADGEEDPDSIPNVIENSIARFTLWRSTNSEAPDADMLEELRMIQTFASLRVQDRVLIFLGSCFTDALLTAGEIVAQKAQLVQLAPTQVLQRHLIAGFEWFCGVRHVSLAKLFPVVLKQLYDEEVVDEEVFFAWAVDLSRNEHTADRSLLTLEALEQLKESAGPFIRWLQEAEEEDEDGEEGDEGEGDEDDA